MSSGHLLHRWTVKPHTGVRKRHITYEHKLTLIVYEPSVADVLHKVKCPEKGLTSWATSEKWECRDGHVHHIKVNGEDKQ